MSYPEGLYQSVKKTLREAYELPPAEKMRKMQYCEDRIDRMEELGLSGERLQKLKALLMKLKSHMKLEKPNVVSHKNDDLPPPPPPPAIVVGHKTGGVERHHENKKGFVLLHQSKRKFM
jgi:hypothetical protein